MVGEVSFWLGTGVPGKEAWQFEDGISASRIRQGQGLRRRLLPGTLLRHRQKLGSLRGEGGGWRAVGAAAGTGWQRGLGNGDGGGKGADLEVGGFLRGTLVLSDLLHGHVCWHGDSAEFVYYFLLKDERVERFEAGSNSHLLKKKIRLQSQTETHRSTRPPRRRPVCVPEEEHLESPGGGAKEEV